MVGSKNVEESMAEFATGNVAMIQNGNWGWAMIYDLDGNVVKKEDIKFLPIYTGVEGEEKQGLCVGTENYICINSKVSEADQKASEKFLEWLFNSESGKAYCNGILGMIPPFSTFSSGWIFSMPASAAAAGEIRPPFFSALRFSGIRIANSSPSFSIFSLICAHV